MRVEPAPREVRVYEYSRGRCPLEIWLTRLKDRKARAIIRERIARLMLGNTGDVRSVGGGILELRVEFGPGYRVHYGEHGKRIGVLLCGGDKSSQVADIGSARTYWEDYRRLTRNA